MREYKFRVWMSVDYTSAPELFYGFCPGYLPFDDRHPPLMEYTGLKDKNGKEIWEGDIIKASPLSWNGDEIIKEVSFKQGMFGFHWREYTTTSEHLKLTAFECEVIGNIYENPKLLEKSE